MAKRVWQSWLMAAVACWFVGCADDPQAVHPFQGAGASGVATGGSSVTTGGSSVVSTAGTPSSGGFAGVPPVNEPRFAFGASCDESRGVEDVEPALVVRDPEVLANFSLEQVLEQIIAGTGAAIEPLELLQRLFDTENATAGAVFTDNVHCDSPDNVAFAGRPAQYCPRAEGQLAKSAGLLIPGDPDYLAPVAIFNRFDLLPSDASTCGQYRLVFAKESGRTDPANRVLLSFDATLPNPSRLIAACRPVAELWASLPTLGASAMARELHRLFFDGIAELPPVITAEHLGAGASRCDYDLLCGEVRVAQGMQEPFEYRELMASVVPVAGKTKLAFLPSTNAGSIRPDLFDLGPANLEGLGFRGTLLSSLSLLSQNVSRISMYSSPIVEAGETAVEGPASPTFRQRVVSASDPDIEAFDDSLRPALTSLSTMCPPDDLLSPLGVVERVTALSCAGCHAPSHVLAEGRDLSCDTVWPESLGLTHVDEHGELSPALNEEFLPYRRKVLNTFLQACDDAAAFELLTPVPPEANGLW